MYLGYQHFGVAEAQSLTNMADVRYLFASSVSRTSARSVRRKRSVGHVGRVAERMLPERRQIGIQSLTMMSTVPELVAQT
jgi:hypothetical protein